MLSVRSGNRGLLLVEYPPQNRHPIDSCLTYCIRTFGHKSYKTKTPFSRPNVRATRFYRFPFGLLMTTVDEKSTMASLMQQLARNPYDSFRGYQSSRRASEKNIESRKKINASSGGVFDGAFFFSTAIIFPPPTPSC